MTGPDAKITATVAALFQDAAPSAQVNEPAPDTPPNTAAAPAFTMLGGSDNVCTDGVCGPLPQD